MVYKANGRGNKKVTSICSDESSKKKNKYYALQSNEDQEWSPQVPSDMGFIISSSLLQLFMLEFKLSSTKDIYKRMCSLNPKGEIVCLYSKGYSVLCVAMNSSYACS